MSIASALLIRVCDANQHRSRNGARLLRSVIGRDGSSLTCERVLTMNLTRVWFWSMLLLRVLECTLVLFQKEETFMAENSDALLRDVLSQTAQEVPLEADQLDHGNDGMTILSSSLMPEFGLLLNSRSGKGHRWWLVFNTTDEAASTAAFLFKCMCCRPEIKYSVGVERCDIIKDEARSRVLAARFRRDLEDVCKRRGITTLFVRNAKAWDDKPYGPLDGIELVEADQMRKRMEEKYPTATVDKAFACISWERSQLVFRP